VRRINDMKEEDDLTVESAGALRKRVEFEDQLLNSRTSIVLTLNGLMAVAVSMSGAFAARLVVAGVIIIVDLLWISCAVDAYRYIKALTAGLRDSPAAPIDERMRQDLLSNRFRVGTTMFMSIIIPGLLLVGWAVVISLPK
jgi:hypothetical protein